MNPVGRRHVAPAEPAVDEQQRLLRRLIPFYRVLLHNDDVNDMEHVIRSLLRSVPSLTQNAAVQIMLTAHMRGVALVIVCPKETAELFRERLESCGLTSTIEPDA